MHSQEKRKEEYSWLRKHSLSLKTTSPLRPAKLLIERFDKKHKDVLQSIREILAAENSATRFFFETSFKNRGKSYPMYFMTRDGFSLLAMGFTGKKALKFKLKFIDAFNKMEARLATLTPDETERLKIRQAGKAKR